MINTYTLEIIITYTIHHTVGQVEYTSYIMGKLKLERERLQV